MNLFGDPEEAEAFARSYGTRRALQAAGVGQRVEGESMTPGERRTFVDKARARYGSAPAARSVTPPARSASLPRSSRSRVESTSGRPGTLTRGPGLAPAAMSDALGRRSDGSDARVCGQSTCKVININHEGPADEYCSAHV